jgi:predicted TIM-barrel fold metal-dependent hydrolase
MALFHTSCMPGTGFSPFATIAELARRNPKTKIVAAHGAGLFQNGNYPFFPNLDSLERVADKGLPKNLWVDTAHYLLYAYPTILQKMVNIAGADHVVFGTDAPLQGPMQMRFMAELVESLDVPLRDKEKIFYRNAEKILSVKL